MTRFGIAINHRDSAAEVVHAASLAESAGFEEIWISEDNAQRGAFSLATAVAMSTRKARIGLGVLNPWTRHPFQIAMEAATLQELSGNRLILGMGAGNADAIGTDLGLAYDKPLSRLIESAELLRASLAGAGDYVGTYFNAIKPLAFEISSPPPLVLGVKSKRAIQRGSQVCDGLLLSLMATPEYLEWVSQTAERTVPISGYVVFACTPDASVAREAARRLVAGFLGVHGESELVLRPGVDVELARELRTRWLRGADATDLVTDEILDLFAIAGDRQMCVRGLRRFATVGWKTLILRTIPQLPLEETIKGFASARESLAGELARPIPTTGADALT